jgi:hypothetical protein
VPLLLLLLVVPLFFLSFLWVPLLVCALCCPLLVDEQASGLPTVSPQAAAKRSASAGKEGQSTGNDGGEETHVVGKRGFTV